MREKMITALKNHFHGEIAKHKMNVDIMETISGEIGKIAEYEDKLMVIETNFTSEQLKL